jgi:putative membrane-bound dehydrogenase-like protein
MIKRFFTFTASLALAGALSAADPVGIQPVGQDGKPLNLDFEDGNLKDWTATGNAFDKQPIKGDTVSKRRNDMKSDHHGQYWIGSFEVLADEGIGTLTSVPFKITHPWGSFLVAGGPHPATKVEIVVKDGASERTIFRASGQETEDLRRATVNLTPYVGKQMFIRIVDQQKGHWGHINFDDFRFYPEQPSFAAALPPAKPAESPLPADVVKFAGLSPEDAAKEMTLPPKFSAKLFAGEPDVKQPIAFAMDDRGRLWVAEGYTYPKRAAEGEGKDRILIFEDTDGDGKFDKRTVFIEGLNLVSGLEVGFGGVWVGAAPYLMFIPIQPGEDKPAGKPEILLDGFAYQDTHETLNTFTWGPDGWLYGCHGVFTHSNVGKPGAADPDRVKINAGIWRFHPKQRQFEVFAEGTSNPWGIDFDRNGQCFIEACVIPHLFHIIQGARYERQAGQHFNPYIYKDITTIADHFHYAGNKGPHAANGRSDAAGGGHAHAGLLVYNGDSWPEQYRGQIFMNNIHGQRINQDSPERKGSGFVGHHAPDFINFNDRWSQILNLISDQNGSVFMIDWYDKNQCHHGNVEGHDRSNGRIFKIVYNDQKWTPVDLQKATDDELVQFQLHRNEWYVRHARRILEERGPNPKVHAALAQILNRNPDPTSRLHALWALHVTGGLTEEIAGIMLKDASEYVRAWTIQLVAEDENVSPALLEQFAGMAGKDPSPVVRLYLASALQRVQAVERGPVLNGLLAHVEDTGDHNLPLMYWYAAEPLGGSYPAVAAGLLEKTKISLVREFMARRIAASMAAAR